MLALVRHWVMVSSGEDICRGGEGGREEGGEEEGEGKEGREGEGRGRRGRGEEGREGIRDGGGAGEGVGGGGGGGQVVYKWNTHTAMW